MPRFSQTEKQAIHNDLLKKGEQLFAAGGLKKVTIDELAAAAHIAKATFYTFFESKEALYLEIASQLQQNIFNDLVTVLEKNKHKPPKVRVKEVFAAMAQMLADYPLLGQISEETVQRIARRVSPQRLEAFAQSNVNAAEAMGQQGIQFTCETALASEAFEAVYHTWMHLQTKDTALAAPAIELVLDGLLDKIIME